MTLPAERVVTITPRSYWLPVTWRKTVRRTIYWRGRKFVFRSSR